MWERSMADFEEGFCTQPLSLQALQRELKTC